jgi:BRCA1 C Terminus (BRCT) domain.
MENFSRGLTEKTAKIDESHKEPVIRKRKTESMGKGDVLAAFRDTNTAGLAVKSLIFAGFEFYIVKSSEKEVLEKLIVENGGTKVQNYLNSTTHVIGSDLGSIRVQNLIARKDLDIISPN